jgi:hypothetical protein
MTNLIVMKTELRRPSASSDNWTIPVLLWDEFGLEKRYPKIDGVDLASIFNNQLGRYPRHELGAEAEFQDVLANWDKLEPEMIKLILPQLEN